MSKKELKMIRDEIKELRLLYKNLVDKAIPLEEPTPSDKSAIKRKEKIVKESSLMKALD
jgi:archaellum component FlaC